MSKACWLWGGFGGLLLLGPALGMEPFLGISCGFGFFAWSGLCGLGVTAVTLGLLHITQLLESFDYWNMDFFNIGGALSSISLSTERAPPLRNSPHTGFICSLPSINFRCLYRFFLFFYISVFLYLMYFIMKLVCWEF